MSTRKVLLGCGIASSLLYVAMNVIAPLQYAGYSVLSQTVSELSAIGAPSAPLWRVLGFVYDVLIIAFGVSVWRSAGRNRSLRVVGCLLAASGAIGFAWPPMHIRGEGFSLTDTMHVVVSAVWVLLSLASLGFGAAAFGRRFRIDSIASLLVGLAERINIGVFTLWVVVLAIQLMRAEGTAASRRSGEARMMRQSAA